MRAKPLKDRIVVQRYEDDKTGAIIIPEYVKQASLRGIVRETGPECQWLNVDDMIVFGRYSGFEFPVREPKYKDCLIMNEEDVLCILTDIKKEE